jgi:hypothetical protein
VTLNQSRTLLKGIKSLDESSILIFSTSLTWSSSLILSCSTSSLLLSSNDLSSSVSPYCDFCLNVVGSNLTALPFFTFLGFNTLSVFFTPAFLDDPRECKLGERNTCSGEITGFVFWYWGEVSDSFEEFWIVFVFPRPAFLFMLHCLIQLE